MNKTVNINLAGIFFHIDEDAYAKLQRYLEAIKRSFTDSQGRSEIIADIEARIAELFSERMKTDRQVIASKEVEDVITIMGQPEDYLVDDEIFEDEPKQKHYSKSSNSTSKKLFRDTENSYVGGVASGLSYYFNIDVIWIRLIWILLVFGAGTGIFLYILLWIFIPEATSTAEKLTMTGEEVTITNIEKKIKDGFESVSENVKNIDFQKHADKLKEGFESASDNISESVKRIQPNKIKSSSKSFFDALGDAFMFFLKLFSKFIGAVLVLASGAGIVGMIIALVTANLVDTIRFPNSDFASLSEITGAAPWLVTLLVFFAFAIPLILLFYLGLKILVSNLTRLSNPAKYSMIGLWLLSVIGLSTLAAKQGLSFAEKAPSILNQKLETIKANDTLVISMRNNDNYAENFNRHFNYFETGFNESGDKITYSQAVRLIVKSTNDDVAKIKVIKYAKGRNFESAKQRAENISYNFDLVNNELLLDNHFLITNNEVWRDQRIEITVYLPIGSIIYANQNTYDYHRNNSNYYNDILNNQMEEHYLLVERNKLKCLDCPEDTEDEEDDSSVKADLNNETSKLKIDNNGLEAKTENGQLKINNEGLKASTKNVKVTIDDDEGVNITSKKDKRE